MRPVWTALAVLLAAPAAAAAAAPETHWSVRASASGGYALDYGDDGDAIDGQADGSWKWEMKAVASGLEIDTETAVFRMSVQEGSDMVAGGAPICRPPGLASVGWVRDSRAGLYLSTSGGFQVNHPFFDLLAGCHVGAHGMTLYDGASPAEAPRGRFRPRRHRSFERTWTQQILLDRTHESGTPHTFSASAALTLKLRRVSARAARRLEARLRAVPRAPG